MSVECYVDGEEKRGRLWRGVYEPLVNGDEKVAKEMQAKVKCREATGEDYKRKMKQNILMFLSSVGFKTIKFG